MNLHIGIILDGNRRFAKKNLKNQLGGHEYGAKKVEQLLDWCIELNIKQLTLYCFSLENFKRSKKEVTLLMNLFRKWFKKLAKEKKIEKHKIKIKFIGNRNLLNKQIKNLIANLEYKTKDNDKHIINFAFAYGGRQEIIEAVKKMIRKKEQITEENLENNLWLKNEPDLIIRTGGEKRTSNFLPWQSVYSEWIFLDKMWPEFTKKDLENSIKEFQKRKRRFGK